MLISKGQPINGILWDWLLDGSARGIFFLTLISTISLFQT